jgi:hypothetical protein
MVLNDLDRGAAERDIESVIQAEHGVLQVIIGFEFADD